MCVRAPVFRRADFKSILFTQIILNMSKCMSVHVAQKLSSMVIAFSCVCMCVVRCACIPPTLHIHLTTKNVFVRISRLSHRLQFCVYFYGIGSFRPTKLLTSPTHKCRLLPIITYNILMPIRHSSPSFVIHETSLSTLYSYNSMMF